MRISQRGEALCPGALRFSGEGNLAVELQILVESDGDGRWGGRGQSTVEGRASRGAIRQTDSTELGALSRTGLESRGTGALW